MSDPIKDFQKRVECDLVVKRVPKKTLDTFKKIANEDFAGDYGMYIKFLQDIYLGIITTGLEHLEEAVNNIDQRLGALETKPVKKEQKYIIMGNGKKIPIKE